MGKAKAKSTSKSEPQATLDSRVYQIKVTLRGTRPPVWRRLQVPGHLDLYGLHCVLQVAMGWTDSHLHQFTDAKRTVYYSRPDFELDDVEDETQVTLGEVAPRAKARLVYEYDFGDSWEHDLLVEQVLDPSDGAVRLPACLAGKRACPPEDCGGVWGYERLLHVIADPDDEEHQDMREWLGEDFDPEAFDPAAVNRALHRLRFGRPLYDR